MIWLFTGTHLPEDSNDKDNLSNKVWFHSSSFSKWCVLSNCCRHEKVLTVKRNQIWHWSHIYSYSIVPAHFNTHTRTKITELNINILKSFNVLIQRNKQCWFIYHHKMLRQKKLTFSMSAMPACFHWWWSFHWTKWATLQWAEQKDLLR